MLMPGDVIPDADLYALEDEIADEFGETAASALLLDARRVAVVDWLAPRLEAAGYDPTLHRTRQAPAYVYGYTASAYTDYLDAAQDTDADDVPLATILATPASDALYIGHGRPFSGLYFRCEGTLNANTSTLSVAVWNGQAWIALAVSDGTQVTTGKTLSGGGRVQWTLPDDWVIRDIDDEAAYWVKVTVSAALTAGTVATQILPMVRSRLLRPALLYVKSYLHRQGTAGRRGAWLEQAKDEESQAVDALSIALPLITDEFDVTGDDAAGTADELPRSSGWTMRRG